MSSRIYRAVAGASLNLAKITDHSANLCGMAIVNTTAAIIYVKLYLSGNSLATPTDATPVVGTTVPWLTIQCPVSAMTPLNFSIPMTCGQTLWIATTGAAADSDTTVIGAGPILQVFYE